MLFTLVETYDSFFFYSGPCDSLLYIKVVSFIGVYSLYNDERCHRCRRTVSFIDNRAHSKSFQKEEDRTSLRGSKELAQSPATHSCAVDTTERGNAFSHARTARFCGDERARMPLLSQRLEDAIVDARARAHRRSARPLARCSTPLNDEGMRRLFF